MTGGPDPVEILARALYPHYWDTIDGRYAFGEHARQQAREEAREGLSALRDAGLLPEWRDMGSAPKDGTRILVYGITSDEAIAQGDKPMIVVAYWWKGEPWDLEDDGETESRWRVECDSTYKLYVEPIHWMPLPPPPGKEAEASEWVEPEHLGKAT